MNKQEFFKFGKKYSFEEEDFITDDSNQKILDFIRKWPDWGNYSLANILYISGTKFSGKTHLSHIWQKLSNAKFLLPSNFTDKNFNLHLANNNSFIIENIELYKEYEVLIFHILNHCINNKKSILLTSSKCPQELPYGTQDLISRLKASNHFHIKQPSEELLKQILFKTLLDYQIKITPEIMDFIFQRIERSYENINFISAILDKQSLELKKNITIPFVKKILNI